MQHHSLGQHYLLQFVRQFVHTVWPSQLHAHGVLVLVSVTDV